MINETLHTFISVTKNGSFNKAAEKLSLTAPAVMKQMNSLEKSVGAPLFERTNRGIRLTPAGESFLKDAKTILRYTRKSIERAQIAAGQTPHLPTCGAQKAGSVHPAQAGAAKDSHPSGCKRPPYISVNKTAICKYIF